MSLYSDLVRVIDGAIGYWRLGDAAGSGTATDSSGGGNNGTVSSGVTFRQAGALSDGDTAALFDGSSGHINTPSFGSSPTTFTIEGWFKTSSVTNFARILSNAFGVAGVNITMQTSGALLVVISDGSTTVTPASVRSNLLDSVWHHVAVTRDTSTTGVLYLDGVRDSTLSGLPSGTIPSTGLTFGRPPAAANWFSGSIDEVAVYSTALSATRIAAHYAAASNPQVVVGVAMPSTRAVSLPNRNKSAQTYGWWSSPNKRKY